MSVLSLGKRPGSVGRPLRAKNPCPPARRPGAGVRTPAVPSAAGRPRTARLDETEFAEWPGRAARAARGGSLRAGAVPGTASGWPGRAGRAGRPERILRLVQPGETARSQPLPPARPRQAPPPGRGPARRAGAAAPAGATARAAATARTGGQASAAPGGTAWPGGAARPAVRPGRAHRPGSVVRPARPGRAPGSPAAAAGCSGPSPACSWRLCSPRCCSWRQPAPRRPIMAHRRRRSGRACGM